MYGFQKIKIAIVKNVKKVMLPRQIDGCLEIKKSANSCRGKPTGMQFYDSYEFEVIPSGQYQLRYWQEPRICNQ